MYSLTEASTATELMSLAHDWGVLFDSQASAHVTNSFPFIAAAAATLHADKPWRCLLAYADSAPVAGVYFVINEIRRGPFCFSVADVGAEVVAELLIAPGCTHAGLSFLLHHVFHTARGPVFLRLHRLRCSELCKLSPLLRSTGLNFLSRQGSFSYALPITGRAADVLSRLGPATRKSMMKTRRRANEQLGSTFEVTTTTDGALNQILLSEFLELEDSGWKGKAGTSILRREGIVAYYSNLVAGFGTKGLLSWFRLLVRGKSIATLMSLRSHSTLWMMKAAYDEDYAAYRPGQELLFEILERCAADMQITQCDFLGASKWLDQWRPDKRDHVELRIYNPSCSGLGTYAVERFRRRMKSFRSTALHGEPTRFE